MTALNDARTHLRKAKEFLDAAILTQDQSLYNAATSNAVSAGINAKDAICLATRGHTNRTDNHKAAVKELELSGSAGKSVAAKLGRLLALKPKSQYGTGHATATDARNAVGWAQSLYDTAVTVVRQV